MRTLALALLLCAVGIGCSGGSNGSGGSGGGGGGSGGRGGSDASSMGDGAGEDLDMQPSDFECILRWTKVREFRITNKLGHVADSLAVANSPTGGVYPVGTVIQLVPFEASVKRARGWSPITNDWEFFSLSVSAQGTTISARGTTNVVNQFGGNCFNCHSKAQPQWDFLCEQNHGCDPLPLTPAQIESIQNSDARCP